MKNKEYCNRYSLLHWTFRRVRQAFFVMYSHSCGNLHSSILCEATSPLKIFFFGTKKFYQQKQGNDVPTIILNLLKWDKVAWTKRIEYGISNCAEKKVKTRHIRYSFKKVKTRHIRYSLKKSKGSSAFDEQKVKNIAIEYRLQSIFPNPDHLLSIVKLFPHAKTDNFYTFASLSLKFRQSLLGWAAYTAVAN